MSETVVKVTGHEVKLTNLEKVFWPEGFTKAHLIKYYNDIAPILLRHIHNRPLVMKRYPNGISGESFYQKECPDYAPDFVETYPIQHSEKIVNYIVCNDAATLVWLANQGCIEVHAWLSTLENIECPDMAVMDLDPAEGTTFGDVMQIALLVQRALEEFELKSYVKTSGASGLHLFIPLEPVYPFKVVTAAMQYLASMIISVYPEKATTERIVGKRKGKVYLDYLQNGRGKTMAFQYGLRPLKGAPVSTPLAWSEVEQMNIDPMSFNIDTVFQRIKLYGDLLINMKSERQLMDRLLKVAQIDFSMKSTERRNNHNVVDYQKIIPDVQEIGL